VGRYHYNNDVSKKKGGKKRFAMLRHYIRIGGGEVWGRPPIIKTLKLLG